MALKATAKYYRANPKAHKVRLAQQRRYDQGNGSTGRTKEAIQAYHGTLAKWKAANKGSKPSGTAEAVHGKTGRIRWASGNAARSHNRGNEVRKRNAPSNPNGRKGIRKVKTG